MKKVNKKRATLTRTSLRTKVMSSFLGLVVLLIFSSVVSLLELRRIGYQTQEILTASDRSMALAGELLDAVEVQNLALQQMFLKGDMSYDSIYSNKVAEMQHLIANTSNQQLAGIDSVKIAYEDYCEVAKFYRIRSAINDTDWYVDNYAKAYHTLIESIREYMLSSQVALGPQALAIEHNAYRAITPSVVTIGAILIIVLMLWYFLDMYGVKSLIKVNRSLGDYLKYGIPYNARQSGNDEIEQLNDGIEELIARIEDKRKR